MAYYRSKLQRVRTRNDSQARIIQQNSSSVPADENIEMHDFNYDDDPDLSWDDFMSTSGTHRRTTSASGGRQQERSTSFTNAAANSDECSVGSSESSRGGSALRQSASLISEDFQVSDAHGAREKGFGLSAGSAHASSSFSLELEGGRGLSANQSSFGRLPPIAEAEAEAEAEVEGEEEDAAEDIIFCRRQFDLLVK